MGYCTLADIEKAVPEETVVQLTDDEGLGVVDQARVDEAIDQADAEIDAYCAARYKTPFSTVPDVVKKLSADIAVYNIYSRKMEDIPAARSERYKNAVRMLEGISKGTVSLGEDPAPEASTEGQQTADITGADRTFSRDKLEDF